MITFIIVLGFIIIFIVLLMAVITTNKAYGYKHTVDPHIPHPHENEEETNVNDSRSAERKEE